MVRQPGNVVLRWLALGAFAFLGWLLFDYFGIGIPCPIRLLSGYPCPGCGMGRACHRLLHADFRGAWNWHPAVYCLAVYVPYRFGLPPESRKKLLGWVPKWVKETFWGLLLVAVLIRWAAVLQGHISV